MKIETKYNIGDKVYFYIEESNKYLWGNILDITISVNHATKVLYSVSNRLYDKNRYRDIIAEYGGRYRDIRTEYSFIFQEGQLFDEPEELIKILRIKALDKIDQIEELKKGLFS